MATYRDAAVAANTARHDAWVTRGQEKTRPLLTDEAGREYLDPLGKTVVVHEETPEDLLILRVDDGSQVHFAVWPDTARPVRVARLTDDRWTAGPIVQSMADVGQAIEDGEV